MLGELQSWYGHGGEEKNSLPPPPPLLLLLLLLVVVVVVVCTANFTNYSTSENCCEL
jgi:hypothetical protein